MECAYGIRVTNHGLLKSFLLIVFINPTDLTTQRSVYMSDTNSKYTHTPKYYLKKVTQLSPREGTNRRTTRKHFKTKFSKRNEDQKDIKIEVTSFTYTCKKHVLVTVPRYKIVTILIPVSHTSPQQACKKKPIWWSKIGKSLIQSDCARLFQKNPIANPKSRNSSSKTTAPGAYMARVPTFKIVSKSPSPASTIAAGISPAHKNAKTYVEWGAHVYWWWSPLFQKLLSWITSTLRFWSCTTRILPSPLSRGLSRKLWVYETFCLQGKKREKGVKQTTTKKIEKCHFIVTSLRPDILYSLKMKS